MAASVRRRDDRGLCVRLAPMNERELGRAVDVLGSADRVLLVGNGDRGRQPQQWPRGSPATAGR
ncbi:hypothetical protein [Rhodococcus opacus]|uniref:hypothetical protein n=1 Tax=Rhodococcus opacus TaxID=37919 RepID=UPI000318DD86|nr:hypothetical protein [Rhodococcus opacus]